MVCIYCSANTSVTNSRSTDKKQAVWRRRRCEACGAVFTTHEQPDLSSSFMVQKNGSLTPFSRDTLYISIYESCKHRERATTDAQDLTKTIITKLVSGRSHTNSAIDLSDIIEISLRTLMAFDTAAGSYYQAYHGNKRH